LVVEFPLGEEPTLTILARQTRALGVRSGFLEAIFAMAVIKIVINRELYFSAEKSRIDSFSESFELIARFASKAKSSRASYNSNRFSAEKRGSILGVEYSPIT